MFNGTELVFLACLCAWAIQNAPPYIAAFAVGTAIAQSIDLFLGFRRAKKKAAAVQGSLSKIEEELSAAIDEAKQKEEENRE